jgi:SAM-dependent methyltransferase
VLQLGDLIHDNVVSNLDLPQLVRVSCKQNVDKAYFDLAANSAFLPFADNSFASVLLPHVLEGHELPHQVLREAHRVLLPEGQLLLTCFNPASFIGLQRILRLSASLDGPYYSPSRVKDWLFLLGFEVSASAMYHYSPLCKSEYLNRKLNFLNFVGDRWLPMLGGSYLIVARKREIGMRLIGKDRAFGRKKHQQALAPAGARKSQLNKQ